ncbi:DUF402 domain-containing protein [Microlunatus soli]|nr:DUF402 domain-containing protein [Microlunatus soli]
MELPVVAVGSTVIAEDRWHDQLWAAVPQRVVSSSSDELISYVPTGAVATRASSRGLPGTAELSRDERKLLALRSRQARVVETREGPDKLFFYRADRWSRINLGWDHTTGAFLGWYVNFEYPARPTATGVHTMDLVLDIWVNPDRTWEWKDRSDYLEVLRDGTLDPGIDGELRTETARVLQEISDRSGPFAEQWLTFRPDEHWACPTLPPSFAWGGAGWSLPAGPRLDPST